MDFSVVRDAYGAPQVVASRAAQIVLGLHLVAEIKVSLTHTPSSATAVALRVPKVIQPSRGGRFLYRWLPYRRQVILDNLTRVYGAQVSQQQIQLLAQAHYGHLLKLLKELLQFRFLSTQQKKDIVKVEGVPEMIKAFEAGKGVLILTGHFGNFEVSTVAGIEHFPQVKGRIHFLRRPIKPKWLSDLLTRRFNQAGFGVVGRRGSLEEIVETLERGDAVRLRSDVERKRLFGLGALDRSAARSLDVYTAEATRRTFDRLADLARIALQAGWPVIVDAAFLRRGERQDFKALAAGLGVPFAILHCHAPEPVLRERAAARSAAGNDASEADVAVLQRQLDTHEALDADERATALDVATDAPVDVAALAARWLAGA